MRDSHSTSIDGFVAMYCHQQFAVETVKKHAMTKIWRRNRVLFLDPWAIECAAGRIGHALHVYVIYPTGPDHTQAFGAGVKKPGAVGDFIGFINSIFIFFAAPGRFAGAEKQFARAY